MGAKGAKTVHGVLSNKRFVSAQDVNCNFPKGKVETCQSGLGRGNYQVGRELVTYIVLWVGTQGKRAQKPLWFTTLRLARDEDENEVVQLYGKNSRSGTCKLCSGSGKYPPIKYRFLLQSVQKTVESLVKRVQTLALQGKARRRKRPNLHLTPIVGV